jgi:hypothetical protein
MAKKDFLHYSIKDFDKFDCLKISPWVYLCLIFILRGYLVWVMSVTNMKDRVGVIQWVYPEPALFYLSLCSGALGLFVLLLLSLRRPDANKWVIRCWARCRSILILAIVFDLFISVIGYYYWQLLTINGLVIQSIIAVFFISMLMINKKFAINLSEFPKKLPE